MNEGYNGETQENLDAKDTELSKQNIAEAVIEGINSEKTTEDNKEKQEDAEKTEEVQTGTLGTNDVEEGPDEAGKDLAENDDDEKSKNPAYVVRTDAINEEVARFYAEREITERQNEKGKWAFFKKGYLHVFEEYEKQKAINKYRKQINEGDFVAKSEFDADKKVAAERLVSEASRKAATEKVVLEAEVGLNLGETKVSNEEFNNKIKELLRDFSENDKMTEEEFTERKETLVNEAFIGDRTKFLEKDDIIDNLFEIAKDLRAAGLHDVAIDKMDEDFSVILGKVRGGLRTEANLSGVDKFIQKIQESRILSGMLEPATIGVAAGLAYSVFNFVTQKASRSVFANISTIGAAGAIGLLYGAARRNKELKGDLAMHAREIAAGGKIAEGSKRREKMELFRVETKSAKVSVGELDKLIGAEEFGIEQYKATVDIIADLKARIEYSDENDVDLISFSDILAIQRERNELDIKIAVAENYLEEKSSLLIESEAKTLGELIDSAKIEAKGRFSTEKTEKDEAFNSYRYKEVAKAGLLGAAIGGTVGLVMHEGFDLFKEQIAFFGFGNTEAVAINSNDQVSFKLPHGVDIGYDENGICQLVQGNEVIVDNVSFNPNGTLTPDTFQEMMDAGINVIGREVPLDGIGEPIAMTDVECVKQRSEFERVYREMWDNNDTKRSDLNELKLLFGGNGGTGIDSEGNFIYDVSNMTKGGSFHEGVSDNYAEALKNGTLKLNLSLSEETQRQVVSIDINEKGEAIIPKDSPVAQMFFENKNGHAVFKGRFAEVANVVGERDGNDIVHILATHEGNGVDFATITEQPTGEEYTLVVPKDFNFTTIPFARNPLEELGKNKETEPIAGQKGEESDEDSGEKGKKRELPYTNKPENLEALKTDITDRVNQYISKEDILGIGGGFAEFIKITGLKTEDYDIKDGSFKLLYAKRLHDILQNEEVGQALESFFGKRKKIPEIKKANNSGPEVGKTLGLGISKRINENLPAEDILENKGSFAEFVGITGLEENKDYIVENGKFKLLHEVRLRRFLQDKNNRNKIQEFFDKLKRTS